MDRSRSNKMLVNSNEQNLQITKGENRPLVVDLDDSLLATDILYECIAFLLRHKPWILLLLPFWLLSGKAYLKRRLTEEVNLDFESLPVNEKLIDWLKAEKKMGRSLSLVSASDNALVAKISERFKFFSFVQGSDGVTNLSGANKLSLLINHYGHDFTYVGNSSHDVIIWMNCSSAVLVGHISKLKKSLTKNIMIEAEFPVRALCIRTWTRSLRLYQWCKNTLIFVPLLLAGPINHFDKILPTMQGFLCFCLMVSGTYLINDLLDLNADRQHRTKRNRPLASGELPILYALLVIPLIFIVGMSLFTFLPIKFIGVCLGYVFLTLVYSFFLKKKPLLDLVVLAILFSLRLLAGMTILEMPISPWLLAFSMFFFFSLATIKRYSECLFMHKTHSDFRKDIPNRGYGTEDLSFLMSIGIASGFCSSMVFFTYIMDPTFYIVNNYKYHKLLWIVCIILNYWLARVWLIASHNEMKNDDPILFALQDKTSLVLGGFILLLIILAHGTFL